MPQTVGGDMRQRFFVGAVISAYDFAHGAVWR